MLNGKKNLKIDEAKTFTGNSMMPTDILELSTPYAFFKYRIDKIASEYNTYEMQKNPNKLDQYRLKSMSWNLCLSQLLE